MDFWVNLLLPVCFVLVFWKLMHVQLFVRRYFAWSTCADPRLHAGRCEGKKNGRAARRGKSVRMFAACSSFSDSSLSGFLVDPCCHHIRFPCSCHLTRSRSAKHKRRGDLSSDTKGRAKSTRINPWDHSTCQVRVVRFYHSCSPPPPPPFPPPSGPTLQGSERTGHRWTSTWHLPSSVRTAGPQPGTVRAQWAPLDLNLGPSELSGHRWTST